MRLRCSLAIAWIIAVVTSTVCLGNSAHTTGNNNMAWGLNNGADETIRSLFSNTRGSTSGNRMATTEKFIDSNRVTVDPNNAGVTARKSLLEMSGPEIFQDSDNLIDSDSNAPHVRVKRIVNLLDSPSRTISIRPNAKSSSPYINRRRGFRKMYKRFSPEETNPADENEAEYANVFDDEGDVDIPGAFLDDEPTQKRNKLEDVYPEITGLPSPKPSLPDTRKRLPNPAVADDLVRRKRDRGEEKEEEVEAESNGSDAEVDCAEGEEEEEEESVDYYEDEEAPETSSRQADRQAAASRPILPAAVDYGVARTSAVNENIENSQSNSEKIQLAESSPNSNAKEDYLRFPSKEERMAALKSKTIASTPAKKSEKTEKTKPNKKSKVNAKKNSQKKLEKEKTRPAPKNISKSPKTKPKVEKRTSSSNVNPVKSVKYLESDRPKDNSIKNDNARKTVPAESNTNADEEVECVEQEEERVDEKERQKRNKSIIIKAIPRNDGTKEYQISQKVDSPKKKVTSAKKAATSSAKKSQASVGEKTGASIGEVKDLLGKLIAKVDGLQDLMSEIRNIRESRLQLSNEEISKHTNSQLSLKSPSSSSCYRAFSWGAWTSWSDCSVTCGQGSESRSRRCLGRDCGSLTAETEERTCRLSDCPATKFLGIFR